MRIHFVSSAVLTLCMTALAPAQTSSLRVLSSNGVQAVIQSMRSDAEHAVGRPLNIEFSTAASLKTRIEAGEAFDVAILTIGPLGDLVKQGKLAGGTRMDFARAGVGVGARANAPKADVSTPESFKQAMLKAKSVVYTGDGASRVTIEKAFEHLGIMDAMRPKIKLTPAGMAPETVAKGEAEYVLTLISEIMPVKGVQLLGPLPKDLQGYASFAVALNPGTRNMDAGKALIQFLSRPAVMESLKSHGMEAFGK